MADATSTDLVVLDDDQVYEILTGGTVDLSGLVSDPAVVQQEMVERILNAANANDVLTQNDVLSGNDVLGVALTINGVKWLKSSIDQKNNTIPVYALINATRGDNGEVVNISCGAMQVMAQLLQFGRLGAFPVTAKFGTTDKPTASGYYPLFLESV